MTWFFAIMILFVTLIALYLFGRPLVGASTLVEYCSSLAEAFGKNFELENGRLQFDYLYRGATVNVALRPRERRNREFFLEVRVRGVQPSVRCEVYPDGGRDEHRSLLGMKDVEIGDTEFDERYVVKTEDVSFTKELLTSQVRLTIDDMRTATDIQDVYIALDHLQLTASKRMDLSDHQQALRFIAKTVVLYDGILQAAEQIPVAVEVASAGKSPLETECQVCGEPLQTKLVRCRMCKTLHHKDCWEYYGSCSTYGCLQKRFVVVKPLGSPEPTDDTSQKRSRRRSEPDQGKGSQHREERSSPRDGSGADVLVIADEGTLSGSERERQREADRRRHRRRRRRHAEDRDQQRNNQENQEGHIVGWLKRVPVSAWICSPFLVVWAIAVLGPAVTPDPPPPQRIPTKMLPTAKKSRPQQPQSTSAEPDVYEITSFAHVHMGVSPQLGVDLLDQKLALAATDGEAGTTWEATRWENEKVSPQFQRAFLELVWPQPVEVSRVVVQQHRDRMIYFTLDARSLTNNSWYPLAGFQGDRHHSFANGNADPKWLKVNGQPLAKVDRLFGEQPDNDELLTFHFTLPFPRRLQALRLRVRDASKDPVEIAEFRVFGSQ